MSWTRDQKDKKIEIASTIGKSLQSLYAGTQVRESRNSGVKSQRKNYEYPSIGEVMCNLLHKRRHACVMHGRFTKCLKEAKFLPTER